MNFKKKNKTKNGFTLVELLLYISIASFVLLSISVALSLVIKSGIKNQAIYEVYDQGTTAMGTITGYVRNAIQINSPATSTNAGTLSLLVASSSISPTIFDLAGGAIRITEGLGNSIPITSGRVVASDLVFSNLSRVGTPGTVKIKFTLSYTNQTGLNEYNFSKTFYGSANIGY